MPVSEVHIGGMQPYIFNNRPCFILSVSEPVEGSESRTVTALRVISEDKVVQMFTAPEHLFTTINNPICLPPDDFKLAMEAIKKFYEYRV